MAFKCKHCSAPVWPLVDDADFVRDHCEEIVRLSAELETAKRGWSDASHQMTADGLEIQTLRTALETAELRIAATEASNREYTGRFHGLTEALETAKRGHLNCLVKMDQLRASFAAEQLSYLRAKLKTAEGLISQMDSVCWHWPQWASHPMRDRVSQFISKGADDGE